MTDPERPALSDRLPSPKPPEEPPEEPQGRLRTTSATLLLGVGLVGLVLGWVLRPASLALDLVPPRVTWFQPAALFLVAAILGYVARATHTAVQLRQRRLLPHEAVNRLVLAKACAIVGALVAGGYLGYALTWVGLRAELAGERIALSLAAAAGALLTVTAALLLERACRVRGDAEEP